MCCCNNTTSSQNIGSVDHSYYTFFFCFLGCTTNCTVKSKFLLLGSSSSSNKAYILHLYAAPPTILFSSLVLRVCSFNTGYLSNNSSDIIAIISLIVPPPLGRGLDELLAGGRGAVAQVLGHNVHGLLAVHELPHAVRGQNHELVLWLDVALAHLRLRDHPDVLDGAVAERAGHGQPDLRHLRVQPHPRAQPRLRRRRHEAARRQDARLLRRRVRVVVRGQVLRHQAGAAAGRALGHDGPRVARPGRPQLAVVHVHRDGRGARVQRLDGLVRQRRVHAHKGLLQRARRVLGELRVLLQPLLHRVHDELRHLVPLLPVAVKHREEAGEVALGVRVGHAAAVLVDLGRVPVVVPRGLDPVAAVRAHHLQRERLRLGRHVPDLVRLEGLGDGLPPGAHPGRPPPRPLAVRRPARGPLARVQRRPVGRAVGAGPVLAARGQRQAPLAEIFAVLGAGPRVRHFDRRSRRHRRGDVRVLLVQGGRRAGVCASPVLCRTVGGAQLGDHLCVRLLHFLKYSKFIYSI
mmetsp:Transcript_12373/g.22111  ORF Transcript_12373/g.22111 Transcript_12373/m.22111 type:complete len:519 (+) Transcript_12373:337-1893(+)